jgi:hypothetical protein
MHLTNTTIIKLKQRITGLNGYCDGLDIRAMQRVARRQFTSHFTK